MYDFKALSGHQNGDTMDWRPSEAQLYCIRAISDLVPFTEAEVMPQVDLDLQLWPDVDFDIFNKFVFPTLERVNFFVGQIMSLLPKLPHQSLLLQTGYLLYLKKIHDRMPFLFYEINILT